MSKIMLNNSMSSFEVASLLLDIKAVNFRPEKPYMFTSGWASPVYIDCRWIISFLEARRRIVALGIELLQRNGVISQIDMVAGGETAGIPFSAWISEAASIPMLYVRKVPKGFGRDAQIEGQLEVNKKVLLIEDLATDGGSKINFLNALRNAGARVTDIFVIFFYDIYPGALEVLEREGVRLHYLCTWKDVLLVAKEKKYYEPSVLKAVESFLLDPVSWSKQNGGRSSID